MARRGQITRIRRNLDGVTRRGMRRVAGTVRSRLRAATPVRTGAARASWDVRDDPTGRAVVVTSDCEYMPDLNRGSSPQAEPGFVESAIRAGIDEVK